MADLKYLECDFYSIEEQLGDKYVHIHGYFYYSDADENGVDYRVVEYVWFYIPIKLFPNRWESEYDEMMQNCKQYMDDITEDECEGYMNDWADRVVELPLSEITPDTPCGEYVSYKA